MVRNEGPFKILLVEDNLPDARMIRQALNTAPVDIDFQWVTDGAEALAFLARQSPHTDAPRPHLVLLDLNLPTTDGWQVLEAMKTDDDLRAIPVVILTGSENEADVKKAHDLHANAYVVKPQEFDRFIHVVGSLVALWGNSPRPLTEGPG